MERQMKARIQAKRRWFTPARQLRIAYRTRWGRLESSIADAILSQDPMRAAAAALKKHMLDTLYDVVTRPEVRRLIQGVRASTIPGAAASGLFRYSGSRTGGISGPGFPSNIPKGTK